MRVILALLMSLAIAACSAGGGKHDYSGVTAAVTLPAVAELATSVGSGHAQVNLILPVGAEPHDASIDPDQIDSILAADVVFFVGAGFQPSVENAVRGHPKAIDLLASVTAQAGDPHAWLDPITMQEFARTIAEAFSAADQDTADVYRRGAAAAIDRLRELHGAFAGALASCERNLIVTSHEAFGHLAARYGLEQHGITGSTPGSEPDPQRLAELIDLVRSTGTTTVFAEAREPDDLAQTLARESGARVEVLDPIERIPPGETYDALMRSNLDVLVRALGCEP